MTGSPIVYVDTAALTLSILIGALASYRAFTSRRVLASPIYRSRALWTGTVAFIAIAFAAVQIAAENTIPYVSFTGAYPAGTSLWGYIARILTLPGSVVVFAWIDRTIGVELEMDFLHRDTLNWSRLRPLAWVLVVVGAVGESTLTGGWEYPVSVAVLAAPVVYSAAVMAAGALRVRDETMRRYLKWMGLMVVSLLFQLVTSSVSFYLNFPLAIFAYFLYRASTSLLKTSPLRIDLGTPPTPLGQTGTMPKP